MNDESTKELITEINKIFDNFLNDVNSVFIQASYKENNGRFYTKKRLNKAIVSRGNIKYLQERILKNVIVIKNS